MFMRVGNYVLGSDQPPFVIAEVGSNWHSFEDCIASIDAAKRCGADAVKFQCFTFKSLYGLSPDRAPKSYNRDYELPLEWVSKLKSRADAVGLEFMCTAFDPDTMRSIDQYVNAHKIASSDLNHKELLDMAVRLRKSVFLSTGASTEASVSLAIAQLADLQVCLMYCIAAYPATCANLFVMDKLKKYSQYVGFSDHTLDYTYLPLSSAKNHGGCAVEKHFNALSMKDTPDAGHSLDELQFTSMVDLLKGRRTAQILPMLPAEEDMLLRHKRRIIAISDIKGGEKLAINQNYGVYRSLTSDALALQPYMVDEIDGKLAAKAAFTGEPLTAAHVKL